MAQRRWAPRWVGWLMVVAAVSFGVASLIHTGVRVPVVGVRDPYPGARIPEAVIGVVLLAGAVTVLARAAYAWGAAVAVTGFAIAGTAVGLVITLGGQVGTGDVVYHVAILATLVVIMIVLVTGAGRRTSRRPGAESRRPRRTSAS